MFCDATRVALARLFGKRWSKTLTDTVAAWRDYEPDLIPLPHLSWRTIGWEKRNPWFGDVLVPELRRRVRAVLG